MFFSPVVREDVNRQAVVGTGADARQTTIVSSSTARMEDADGLHTTKSKAQFLNRTWP